MVGRVSGRGSGVDRRLSSRFLPLFGTPTYFGPVSDESGSEGDFDATFSQDVRYYDDFETGSVVAQSHGGEASPTTTTFDNDSRVLGKRGGEDTQEPGVPLRPPLQRRDRPPDPPPAPVCLKFQPLKIFANMCLCDACSEEHRAQMAAEFTSQSTTDYSSGVSCWENDSDSRQSLRFMLFD